MKKKIIQYGRIEGSVFHEPETKKLLSQVKKHILKYYGKPCKETAVGCINCQVWTAYRMLDVMMW